MRGRKINVTAARAAGERLQGAFIHIPKEEAVRLATAAIRAYLSALPEPHPAPIRRAPEIGRTVFVVDLELTEGVRVFKWDNGELLQMLLARGRVHLTIGAARKHANAAYRFIDGQYW